jgi:predicted transcriptional regulator of viral defense system
MNGLTTYSCRVREAIRALKTPVFTTRDVVNSTPEASRALVDQVISRMVRAGELQRISRGLFSRPKVHSELGLLPPHSEDIAASVERSIGMPVVPSGALALNVLGLSQQVPAKLEFKSAGPSRIIQVGKRQIQLRHAPAHRFRARTRIVALVIEALTALGRQSVTPDTIKTIRTVISASDRAVVRKHIGDAPIWMQPHLRQITAE